MQASLEPTSRVAPTREHCSFMNLRSSVAQVNIALLEIDFDLPFKWKKALAHINHRITGSARFTNVFISEMIGGGVGADIYPWWMDLTFTWKTGVMMRQLESANGRSEVE
jgi:hypothetical protein